jgi:hypothetical protein
MASSGFFQFSLGDIGVVITLIVALYKGQKWFMGVQKWLDIHEVEHEILIRWYCTENRINVHDLPTRKRR